jgi:TonB family protein
MVKTLSNAAKTTRWALVAIALSTFGLASSAGAQNIREEVKKGKKPKLTKPPKLTKFVKASYPQDAIDRRIGGKVIMSVTIDKTGKVTKVEVKKTPLPSLGKAAIAAVKQFLFSPAEVDNKPAPVIIRYAYNFVLRKDFEPRLPWWVTGDKPPPKATDVVIGQVREAGNRLPLPGVAVAVMEAGLEVKSDSRGRFSVQDLPPGTYTVQAISLQHKRQVVKITVTEGTQSRIKFYLEPLKKSAYETVVRGKRRQTAVTRVALRGRQLTTVPGTFGDPVRVVENLPGVARIPYVGGALLIRGAAPGDSGTFFDGVRIPLIYHFFGGPSVLNPEFIKRIDYYPGNADSRYGRLTAGVVDVASRNTFADAWHGSFDINLLNIGLQLQVPLHERVSVTAAIRRSYIDAILPLVFSAADVKATTVVPVYYDYQLRVDVKLSGDDRASVLFFGSDDDLKLASNEEDSDFSIDFNSKTTFHRIVGQWRSVFANGKAISRLQPWVGLDLVSFDTTGFNVEIRSRLFGVREDFEYKAARNLRLRAGADVEINIATFEAQIPVLKRYRDPGAASGGFGGGGGGGGGPQQTSLTAETERFDITQTIGSVGLYVDAIWNLTPKLTLIPGLRFDLFFYQEDNIKPSLGPRLTLRYDWLEQTTLKAAAGMYSRAPSPGLTNAVTGNPNLQIENAAHFAIGVEQRLPFYKPLFIDAQLYYLHRYDQAVRNDNSFQVQDQTARQQRWLNTGRGFSTGLELIIKHDVTRYFYGWIAYTLSLSKQQRVAGGEMVRFAFDQRHILTVVGSVRFGTGWEFGARFRLVTGRPETPVLGGVFDSDGNNYTQNTGEEFSVSRPVFHQLDLRLEKTWLFKLWRLSLYLDVQNVYNASNAEATLYDYRFLESGPLPGLPLLPTFGVKGSF